MDNIDNINNINNKQQKIRVGIIEYPGSNCAKDFGEYFKDQEIKYIWHKQDKWVNIDLLVIPGGFAFGDRYYEEATGTYTWDPGTMAINSPVSKIILEANKRKVHILGICNGFQILIKMGLLPGSLNVNRNNKFTCKKVECMINSSFTNDNCVLQKLCIANKWGNYNLTSNLSISPSQIIAEYIDYDNVDNVNGDINRKVAGVMNKDGTVFGMMPHPERTNNQLIKSIIVSYYNKILNYYSSLKQRKLLN